MILGVIVTLVVVAIIVQLFLRLSTKRRWFRYGNPED
jgi:hypothetical protein